jgi:hypothetical protein
MNFWHLFIIRFAGVVSERLEGNTMKIMSIKINHDVASDTWTALVGPGYLDAYHLVAAGKTFDECSRNFGQWQRANDRAILVPLTPN